MHAYPNWINALPPTHPRSRGPSSGKLRDRTFFDCTAKHEKTPCSCIKSWLCPSFQMSARNPGSHMRGRLYRRHVTGYTPGRMRRRCERGRGFKGDSKSSCMPFHVPPRILLLESPHEQGVRIHPAPYRLNRRFPGIFEFRRATQWHLSTRR
jgi:hypothetical protein